MRICPTCRTAYPTRGRATCAKDGTRLVEAEEFAASRNDPLLGHTVAGRFRVIERIGTGGMGTVYRAQQSGLGRAVALKVLKKELVSDRDTVARFHREAKAMSLLMHPNTVRVFDFGEDEGGHLFLAMELLEGELLTSWIEREGTPPVDEAVEVIREILRSLGEAHSKGIIHRDLKPDNIYLAAVDGHLRPVVKVLDFGIAKVFREDSQIDQLETQAGTVFGTPRYMSPEQAQGKTLDHRSDLYAVGVLLYHLLCGRPPFLDDDAVVVMAKHIREIPEPPRKLAPDRPIPRSLEKVVMRALAKEPNDRFDSAEVFEAALAECQHDVIDEIEHAASGGGSRLFGTMPRVPLAIGGGLVLGALVLAVAIVATSGPDDVAEARDIAQLPTDRLPTDPLGTDSEPTPLANEPPREVARTPVTLESSPSGAEIWRGNQRIGETPRTFELTDGERIPLTLRLDGHASEDIELSAASAPSTQVALSSGAASRGGGRRAPSRGQSQSGDEHDDGAHTPPASGSGDPYERFEF